jgi:hypothetical protein
MMSPISDLILFFLVFSRETATPNEVTNSFSACLTARSKQMEFTRNVSLETASWLHTVRACCRRKVTGIRRINRAGRDEAGEVVLMPSQNQNWEFPRFRTHFETFGLLVTLIERATPPG